MIKNGRRINFYIHSFLFWAVELQRCLAIVGLLFIVFINLIHLVMRFFFSFSFSWVQEITLLVTYWVVFLGFSTISYHRKDFFLTIFVDNLPCIGQRIMEILAAVINICFLVLLVYSSINLLDIQTGDQTLLANIPKTCFTYPLILSSITIIGLNLLDIGRVLRFWE